MPWIFNKISPFCFVITCVSPNLIEVLWSLFSLYMFADSLIPCLCRLIFSSKTQCYYYSDFWSFFSVYFSSLFILCPTNSSYLNLPKLGLLWFHYIKTDVICLQADSQENHGAYLVHFPFSWLTALHCLFPMSENNVFLSFKFF